MRNVKRIGPVQLHLVGRLRRPPRALKWAVSLSKFTVNQHTFYISIVLNIYSQLLGVALSVIMMFIVYFTSLPPQICADWESVKQIITAGLNSKPTR